MLFTFAYEAAGASGARLSLRPPFSRGTNVLPASGASRRENADARHRLRQTRSVCARERTRRRDPDFFAALDRFDGACHRARVRDDEEVFLPSQVTAMPLSRVMRIVIKSHYTPQGFLMQSPRKILADLWTLAGGEPAALDGVTLTGEEPQLPSSFRVAAAAQVGIAAAGLAAARIWKLRSERDQQVAVDIRHAVVECRSERYLRLEGTPPPPAWDAIAGIYKTRDHRFVRLHTNFPHHRDAVCRVLNCKAEREEVQAALMQWDAEAFETAAYGAGGVVAMMRSHDEWSELPQAKQLAALPVIEI